MNRARQVTLLLLAAVAIAFAATWLMLPTGRGGKIKPPASLFAHGLTRRPCVQHVLRRPSNGLTFRECVKYNGPTEIDDVPAVKQRVEIVFGTVASVVALIGLAFGAARRASL